MKYSFPLLLVLVCATGFAQRSFLADIIKNDKEIIAKNSILKERIYSYKPDKKGFKDSTLDQVNYYNALGYLIRSTGGPDETTPKGVIRYHYLINNTGELLKKVEDDSSLNLTGTMEFVYDSLGRKVLQYFYNKDTSILSVEKEVYDAAGHLVQALSSSDNKIFYMSRKYFYNAQDSLVKEEALDATGANTFSFLYEYDSSNRSKMQYLENNDGKNLAQEVTYNLNHQLIKNERILNAASDEVEEYSYNEDGTEFQCSITMNGRPLKIYRHYYFK